MIQDWPGALYKKDDTAFLCWTYSPEVTYVLEYTPSKIDDSEIIKMAESAEPVKKNHSLHFKSERDCGFLFMRGHDFSIIPSWKNVILSRRTPPKQVILQIQNTRRYSYETER